MPDAPSFDTLDDAAYQRALAILVDVGTSLAQELKTPSADTPLPARAAAYDRVAEAVRRTIILSKHIADGPPARDTKRTIARRQVIRAVEDTIDREARAADTASLRVELLERLDAPEFIEDLDHRSPADLIRELCRDLGLDRLPGVRRPLRRTPADIAVLCAQAAAPPGSGLPQWLAATAPQATKNDTPPPIRLKEH